MYWRCIIKICFFAALITGTAYGKEHTKNTDTLNTSDMPSGDVKIVRHLTLQDAIDLALRHNPDVEQARIERIAQKFDLRTAKWQFKPHYALTATKAWERTTSDSEKQPWENSGNIAPQVGITTPIGTQLSAEANNSFNQGYHPELTFEVVQPLIKGFGKEVVQAALKDAMDQETINKLDLKDTVISTITTTINDYVTIVKDEYDLSINQEALKRDQEILKQTELYIKTGNKARVDAVQAKAQIAIQEAALQSIKTQISNDTSTLLDFLGIDPNTQITVSKELHADVFTLPTLTDSQTQALMNNITYQVSRTGLNITRRALLTAKDENRWDLDFSVSHVLGDSSSTDASTLDDLYNGENSNTTAKFDLTIPIDDMDLKNDKVDAQVALRQAQIALNEQKRSLGIGVQTSFDSLKLQKHQIELDKMSVKYSHDDYDAAKKLYKAGNISNFALSQHEDQLRTAQQQQLEDSVSYFLQLANFDATLGHTLETWDIKLNSDGDVIK